MSRARFSDVRNAINNLSGKVIFVTGGTSGLGANIVSTVAEKKPSKLVFTGRNEENAARIIERVKSSGYHDIEFIQCDQTSLQAVKSAAKRFLSTSNRLDVLLCNAGVAALPPGVTQDGHEIQFGINHLSHAMLIEELLPTMQATAELPNSDVRIVMLGSSAHQMGPTEGIVYNTIHSNQETLSSSIPLMSSTWARYGQSKLASMLYATSLARHYPKILSVSVHPGVIMTDLFNNLPMSVKFPVLLATYFQRVSVDEGTHTPLWAMFGNRQDFVNGEFYEPSGKPGKRMTKAARDPALVDKLWEWTQKELVAC